MNSSGAELCWCLDLKFRSSYCMYTSCECRSLAGGHLVGMLGAEKDSAMALSTIATVWDSGGHLVGVISPEGNSAIARTARANVCGENKFCTLYNSSPNISRLRVSDLSKHRSILATRRRQGSLRNSWIVGLQRKASRLQAAKWQSFRAVYLVKISLAAPGQPKALKCSEEQDKVWLVDNHSNHSRHTGAIWWRPTKIDERIVTSICGSPSATLLGFNSSSQWKIPKRMEEPELNSSCMCSLRTARQRGNAWACTRLISIIRQSVWTFL